jgi:hypothetical protein
MRGGARDIKRRSLFAIARVSFIFEDGLDPFLTEILAADRGIRIK